MAIENLEVVVSANTTKAKSQLNNFQDDIEWFNKRIKSQTAIEYSIKVAKLREDLKDLDIEIKDARKKWDKDAVITFRAKTELLKKDITQANRELRNYIRTWDKAKSVLGNLIETWSKAKSTLAGLFEATNPKGFIQGLKQWAFQLIWFASAAGAAWLALQKLFINKTKSRWFIFTICKNSKRNKSKNISSRKCKRVNYWQSKIIIKPNYTYFNLWNK